MPLYILGPLRLITVIGAHLCVSVTVACAVWGQKGKDRQLAVPVQNGRVSGQYIINGSIS